MNDRLTAQLAQLNAAVARAQIRAMGMQAENESRQNRGESPAYVEEDFVRVIDDEGIGFNQAVMATRS